MQGLVSVIMSNYNTPTEYLVEAIESVLNQTYTNFELIIVDDCSTDNSLEIIKSYKDSRIVVLENEENLGITKSLNKALAVAKGEYIARMDADDVCLTERFSKQVEFLENNPQVVVCGTGVELIGDWQERHSNKTLCRDIPNRELFKIYLLFGNYPNIVHPTAMFNASLLKSNNIKYDERYPVAQDYKMWVTCCDYGECVNLKETLLYYRVHIGAVSSAKTEKQYACAVANMREQLEAIGIELTTKDESIHYNFLLKRQPYDVRCKEWLKKIICQNKIHKIYNQKLLKKVLWEKWTETSYFALAEERNPIKIIEILFNLPLKYWGHLIEIRKYRHEKEW